MADAPHGPLVFGVESEDGGGGGPCIGAQPLAYGAGRIGNLGDTRYLQPPGEFTGNNLADQNPLPYRIQATATLKRFELRVRSGAGNGTDVEYEVMRMVPPGPAGVPTPLPSPMLIVLPSTFTGVASIAVDNVCTDGDELVLEVRKTGGIGSSPMDLQAYLQFEDECGGGAGGETCCSPTYIPQSVFFGEGPPNLGTTTEGELLLAASICGQDEPITAAFRPAFDELLTPPIVNSVTFTAAPIPLLFIEYDSSAASDGEYSLHILNACGCCTIVATTVQSG